MEQAHGSFLVPWDAVAAPMELAQPIKRTLVTCVGGSFEPLESIGPVVITEGHVTEAEHGAWFTSSGRFAIPVPGLLDVARDAYAAQMKPAHRQNRVGVAFPGRFRIEGKSTSFIERHALALQACNRLVVKLVLSFG